MSITKCPGHMRSLKLNFSAAVLTLGLKAKIFENLRLCQAKFWGELRARATLLCGMSVGSITSRWERSPRFSLEGTSGRDADQSQESGGNRAYHKLDGIGVALIRTFPFSSDFRLRLRRLSSSEKLDSRSRKQSGRSNQSRCLQSSIVIGLFFRLCLT